MVLERKAVGDEAAAWMRRLRPSARSLGIASRVVAAALGGYVLSALCAVALAVFLPLARPEAVLTGTMLSFIVYTGAVIWVFAAASAIRAWIGLAVPSVALALGLLAGGAWSAP